MDGTVYVWNLQTGQCQHALTGHTSLVGLLGLSPSHLVSAAADSTLCIWDPDTGELQHTLAAYTGAITCFQHDECKVLSGSDGNLKIWNIRDGTVVRDSWLVSLVFGMSFLNAGGVWRLATETTPPFYMKVNMYSADYFIIYWAFSIYTLRLFYTGEGAARDEHGYVWIKGRVDGSPSHNLFFFFHFLQSDNDILFSCRCYRCLWHRLSTAEVESALIMHKGVAETAGTLLKEKKKLLAWFTRFSFTHRSCSRQLDRSSGLGYYWISSSQYLRSQLLEFCTSSILVFFAIQCSNVLFFWSWEIC